MQKHNIQYGYNIPYDCGICLNKMNIATKLCCGHSYHSNCILKMTIKNKKYCPICNESFDKYYNSALEMEPTNVLEDLIRGTLNPLWERSSRVSGRDIDTLEQLFPNIPRSELEAEIANTGSIERAIVNISEWA